MYVRSERTKLPYTVDDGGHTVLVSRFSAAGWRLGGEHKNNINLFKGVVCLYACLPILYSTNCREYKYSIVHIHNTNFMRCWK